MTPLYALMQREWLQHRLGWVLLVTVPLALALLLVGFGQAEFDGDMPGEPGPGVPVLMAVAAILGSTFVVFAILVITSLFIVSGLARRDHADRSIEFWLSLPVSHVRSLGVPLLVHLLLVPAAALGVGLLGGYVLSLVLVSRVSGLGAWFDLPWVDLVVGTFAVAARLLAGLPLAVLWLLPLILLVVLSTALFRRWGLPILAVGLGLGAMLLENVFGAPMLAQLIGSLARNGGQALATAGGTGISFTSGEDALATLRALPCWAWQDFVAALRALASPLFVGAVVFAAGGFAALVEWRQRGAGMARK